MKKQQLTITGTVLTVAYPTIGKSLTFDFSTVGGAVRARAEAHGWGQRFGDLESGKSPLEKYTAALKLRDHLLNGGDWELRGDGGSLFVEAVAAVRGITVAEAADRLGRLSEEQVKALRGNDRIKAAELRLRSERANARIAEADDDSLDAIFEE